jgi:hypothetical protein
MKVRRRKHRKTPAPRPIPQPPDLTVEIEQSVEARDKLKAAVARFDYDRDQSKSVFLRSLAGEMSACAIDAYRVLGRFAAWHAQDGRAAQEGDALRRLSRMFKERVEEFKSKSKDETVAALRRIIERLTAGRDKPGADTEAIDKQIERLLAELESLSATAAPVTPPPAKDKPRSSRRPTPSKTPSRERGEI